MFAEGGNSPFAVLQQDHRSSRNSSSRSEYEPSSGFSQVQLQQLPNMNNSSSSSHAAIVEAVLQVLHRAPAQEPPQPTPGRRGCWR